MSRKLTHEDVDGLENDLRLVQNEIEAVARKVCDVGGEAASGVWGKLSSLSEEVAGVIHVLYKLRP